MRVVVEADKIQAGFGFGDVFDEHLAVLDAASPSAVPNPLHETSQRPIDGAPAVLGVEEGDVFGHAELDFRVLGFEGPIDRTVGEQ